MYYVNKIVGWALSPIGMLFLGLAFGMLLCMFGNRAGGTWRKAGKWVLALAVAQAWIFGCGVTTRIIGVPLEGVEREFSAESLPCADAIVLLGGGMGCHEKCGRAEIYGGADRVWMAARAFKAGKAPFLTVSGGGADGEIAFLADFGVDTNRIVKIEDARNTEEEARLIAKELATLESSNRRIVESKKPSTLYPLPSALCPQGKPKVLLVTSAWHMPRAKMLFERAGLDVMPAPTDYEMNAAAEAPLGVGDFFSNADALVRNSYAVKEWVARFGYWLKK